MNSVPTHIGAIRWATKDAFPTLEASLATIVSSGPTVKARTVTGITTCAPTSLPLVSLNPHMNAQCPLATPASQLIILSRAKTSTMSSIAYVVIATKGNRTVLYGKGIRSRRSTSH